MWSKETTHTPPSKQKSSYILPLSSFQTFFLHTYCMVFISLPLASKSSTETAFAICPKMFNFRNCYLKFPPLIRTVMATLGYWAAHNYDLMGEHLRESSLLSCAPQSSVSYSEPLLHSKLLLMSVRILCAQRGRHPRDSLSGSEGRILPSFYIFFSNCLICNVRKSAA